MTEAVLFPSILGKSFHPKEPYWGCWLGILLVASAENVWAYRSLSHCHSGLTAPGIDQGWHQEPHSATDVKCEPQLFQHIETPSTPAVCGGHSISKGFSQKLQGRRNIGFSLNFPTIYQLSKAQEMSNITYLLTEKSLELPERRTHRSQPEMKILSTLNTKFTVSSHITARTQLISESGKSYS